MAMTESKRIRGTANGIALRRSKTQRCERTGYDWTGLERMEERIEEGGDDWRGLEKIEEDWRESDRLERSGGDWRGLNKMEKIGENWSSLESGWR